MIAPWTPSLPILPDDWRATLEKESRAVVFFWAVWSPPDQRLARGLERVAPGFAAHLAFYAANVDERWACEAAREARIFTTPTLAFFRFGKPDETVVGVLGDGDLGLKLESWLRLGRAKNFPLGP